MLKPNEKNFVLGDPSDSDKSRRASMPCPWCKSRDALISKGVYRCSRCSYEVDVSGPQEIRVIGWTTAKDNDFLDCDCKTFDIYRAIISEVKEKGYMFDWSSHQSDIIPCTPIINNGYKIYCGPRTWGSIMAEAHFADSTDNSAYAEFSFGHFDKPIYPSKHVDYDSIIPFEIDE